MCIKKQNPKHKAKKKKNEKKKCTHICYLHIVYQLLMYSEVQYDAMTLMYTQNMHTLVFFSKRLEDSSYGYAF